MAWHCPFPSHLDTAERRKWLVFSLACFSGLLPLTSGLSAVPPCLGATNYGLNPLCTVSQINFSFNFGVGYFVWPRRKATKTDGQGLCHTLCVRACWGRTHSAPLGLQVPHPLLQPSLPSAPCKPQWALPSETQVGDDEEVGGSVLSKWLLGVGEG